MLLLTGKTVKASANPDRCCAKIRAPYRSRVTITTSGGSKKIEKGVEDNLSAPSSFIANAHNEIYAFYTEKSGFLTKNIEPIREGGRH